MLTSIRRALTARRDAVMKDEREGGFTLVELIIVIVIIGILAAIAIPVFIGQQNSATDARAEADLASAKIAVISCATATDCDPEDTDDVAEFGWPTGGLAVLADFTSAQDFCLQAQASGGLIHINADETSTSPGAC